MTTEHDNDTTPADLPAAAEGLGTVTPPEAAAGAEDAAPSEVTLAHLQAMHDRLLKLRASNDELHQVVEKLRSSHVGIAAMLRDEVLPQVSDLTGTMTEHADHLDALETAIGEMGTKVAPLRRGEVERRLPPATSGITASSSSPVLPPVDRVEAEALAQPGAFDPGKVTPLTELHVDPTKVGQQVVQLPSGGELVVNVRRPPAAPTPAGGGVLRDGRRTTGGTRRR